VRDATGNLYGTTNGGGVNGPNGTVFKLLRGTNGQWSETVLHSYPYGNLIFDAAGNLYGTAASGGNLNDCYGFGCGVVFEITP
jgi:hypothetical protein